MKNKCFLVLIIFFISLNTAYSQELKGVVIDSINLEKLSGAKILSSEGNKVLTDSKGEFSIKYEKFPLFLIISYPTYETDSVKIVKNELITVRLQTQILESETVTVTTSRRRQNVEDASISLEVLKAKLIDNKGVSDLEQIVDQSPGVYAMDGQVSIRGGSGFAYGAGSRVLLLWNGVPLVSADAGDVKWNTIPLESVSQIEVIKGASSVLYGSGALNGIISLTEKEPSTKQEIRFKLQNGIYGNPKRESLRWWSKNPSFQQVDFYASKMFKKVGYTFSFAGFTNKGFRQGELEQRIRTSGSIYFRTEKIKNLKSGIAYNLQFQKTGNFIIWQNDSLGYTPSGGSDTSNLESSLTFNRGIRLSLDPYLKYIDSKNNIHNLKTRIYFIDNLNYNNRNQNSNSLVSYADYQFQRDFGSDFVLTAGTSFQNNQVKSTLYGNHYSNNLSLYAQLEKKYKKFYFLAGLRAEYNEQDSQRGDSDFYFGKDSTRLPVFPIVRLAANYQLAKYTKLRLSFGQGVRYPSIAERYTLTSVGSLNVFPNKNLRREEGWAAEIGVKQGVKFGKWKGLLDLSAFVNEYNNMTEFTFGFYLPDSIPPSLDPNAAGYLPKWFGFQAQNAEKARITGLEFSFNCEGKIRQVELTALMGYTYMNPLTLNTDSLYLNSFSNSNSRMLKYRFTHLAKADLEAQWKKISLGFSMRYASFMENIDYIFENPFLGVEILPGLKEYREKYNKGSLVFDTRIAYEFSEKLRLGFMVNNVLNAEYTSRPGDIQAPRTFLIQVQAKF